MECFVDKYNHNGDRFNYQQDWKGVYIDYSSMKSVFGSKISGYSGHIERC